MLDSYIEYTPIELVIHEYPELTPELYDAIVIKERFDLMKHYNITLDDLFLDLSLRGGLLNNLALFERSDFYFEFLEICNYDSMLYLLSFIDLEDVSDSKVLKLWTSVIDSNLFDHIFNEPFEEHDTVILEKIKLLIEYGIEPQNKKISCLSKNGIMSLELVKFLINSGYKHTSGLYEKIKDRNSRYAIKRYLHELEPKKYDCLVFSKIIEENEMKNYGSVTNNKNKSIEEYTSDVMPINEYLELLLEFNYHDLNKLIPIIIENIQNRKIDKIIMRRYISHECLKILFNNLTIKDFTDILFIKFNKGNLFDFQDKVDINRLMYLFYITMMETKSHEKKSNHKKELYLFYCKIRSIIHTNDTFINEDHLFEFIEKY